MSNFLVNMINRHIGLDQKVLPRTRGRFEPYDNTAPVFLSPHTPDESDQLKPASILSKEKTAKDERIEHRPTREPVNDQSEPTVRSNALEIIKKTYSNMPVQESIRQHDKVSYYQMANHEETYHNPTPKSAYPSILESSSGINDERRTSAPVMPVHDSIRQHDKVSDYQTTNLKATIKNGSDDTVHKAVTPSMTTNEKSHTIIPDKPGSQILAVPKNSYKGLLDQRTNKHQTPKSGLPSHRSVHLAEKHHILDSQPDSVALQNTNAGSSALLEIPASLSQHHIESAQGLSVKDRKGVNEPVIKVTIGRIDVRAVMQQTPLTPRRTVPPKPKMSLDDYLKKRSGDQR